MSVRQVLPILVLMSAALHPSDTSSIVGDGFGPYKAVIKELFKCQHNGQGLIKYDTRIDMIGRNKYAFSGNISMVDIDDKNTEILVNCSVIQPNGGIKSNYFVTRFKRGCTEALRFASEYMNDLFKSMGKKVPVKCPIKGGSYTIDKVSTLTHFSFPVIFYQTLKIEVGIIKNRARAGCLGFIIDFIPA